MQQGTGDMSEEHWVWRFNIYKSGNDVPLDHWKGHQTLKEGGINNRQSDKEAWFCPGNPGDFLWEALSWRLNWYTNMYIQDGEITVRLF